MKKPHQRVLHAPYIPPFAATQFLGIIADVAGRLLGGEYPIDPALDFTRQLIPLPSSLIPIPQIRNGGVHPLAPEFRLPAPLTLRLRKERSGDIIDIAGDNVILDHGIEPLAERTVQLHFGKSKARHSNQKNYGKNGSCLHINMISHTIV